MMFFSLSFRFFVVNDQCSWCSLHCFGDTWVVFVDVNEGRSVGSDASELQVRLLMHFGEISCLFLILWLGAKISNGFFVLIVLDLDVCVLLLCK
jgi:hypothetical protein